MGEERCLKFGNHYEMVTQKTTIKLVNLKTGRFIVFTKPEWDLVVDYLTSIMPANPLNVVQKERKLSTDLHVVHSNYHDTEFVGFFRGDDKPNFSKGTNINFESLFNNIGMLIEFELY